MSLVTFIQVNNGAAGTLVMPAATDFPKRKIYGIYVGHEGVMNGCIITITNSIADSGATYTVTLGNDTSGATNGISRGFTIGLPYKGLPFKTDIATTVMVLSLATTTFTVMIDYERG